MIEYELIRSNRKTLTIQVKPDGSVIVRAPVRLAKYRIAKFVKDHETWIFAQQEKLEKYHENMHVIMQKCKDHLDSIRVSQKAAQNEGSSKSTSE